MWEWFIDFLTSVLSAIEGVVGDWGLAVIVLTIIIRLILTPLMAHSTKSTARMQVMQPKLREIQDRYADDPQRQAEELRKVYADMKFNPLGGCLPIILQMPIFFGLFSVARDISQLDANASFFNILPSISTSCANMAESGDWIAAAPYIILNLLFGVLTFIPMVMNSSMQDSSQKTQTMTMGAVMAVMMIMFGWGVPAAVLLYYVTSSLWQVVQQRIITKGVMAKAKAKAEEEAANSPVEVNVVRREKKQRQHKKN